VVTALTMTAERISKALVTTAIGGVLRSTMQLTPGAAT